MNMVSLCVFRLYHLKTLGEHTLDPAREENEGAYFHCLTANGFYFLFYSTRHTKKDRITVQ